MAHHLGIDPDTFQFDERTFAAIVDELVLQEAPRVFAVVQERGRRLDGRIAAWGLAFEERATVIGVDGSTLFAPSPDCAVALYGLADDVTAHVVWLDTARPRLD